MAALLSEGRVFGPIDKRESNDDKSTVFFEDSTGLRSNRWLLAPKDVSPPQLTPEA
jgi:hypothetical protein